MTAATNLTIVYIVAGEGIGNGHRNEYAGTRTARALKMALKRACCGGDRWARAEAVVDTTYGPQFVQVDPDVVFGTF